MTRDKLRNIFQSSFSYENWQSVLVSLFSGVGKNCQLSLESTPQQMPVAKEEKMDGFYIGEIRIGMESVKLYTFHIKDDRTNISRNRVGLRNTVNYLRDVNDAAIVVYYNDHQWRVSYICDIIRSLKRFSFVFGDQQTLYTTPIKRFESLSEGDISLDSILEAFSVEALSKDFFKSYKAQYDKFCNHIGNHIKSNRDYVKKMMGRLVFLQFLQKKGWMNGDYNYMQNLFTQSPYQDDFLEEVLEPLFFHVLNTKEQERNHPKLKNLGDKIHIPYLNGGLFEADENDKKKVTFDVKLFADLFDFFSHYNFTIDENDPNDAEVGIDPEMLGHIFENLLEDNNDKGAFYTPKEIVQYMCRQSLIEYLQSKLGKHIEIENFINNHDTGNRLDGKNYIIANAKAIEELLDNVKICDPAIGSGAFPMGVLNEIFQAKMALDMTLDRAAVKKNIIQNSIYGVDIEQGAVDIARLRFWLSLVVDEDEPQPLPNLDYKIMCGNSLLSRYALDMPFEDVFKEYNKGKSESARMSLAKYKQLVTDYTNTSDHTQKAGFRNTIEEIKNAFRTELSRGEKEKSAKLKGQIADLESPMLFGERTKKEKEDLKKLKVKYAKKEQEQADIVNNKLYEDAFEWRFEFPQLLNDEGNFVGFDIVIGNPPYIFARESFSKKEKDYYSNNYKTAKYQLNTYMLFIERSIFLSKEKGISALIVPNSWLMIYSAEYLRSYLLQNCALKSIVNVIGKAFKEANVETIVMISKKEIEPKNTINILTNSDDMKEFIFLHSREQKSFCNNKGYELNLFSNDESSAIIEKIKSQSNRLDELCSVKAGLQAYEQNKGIPLQTKDDVKNRPYDFDRKYNENTHKYLEGADVKRYGISWGGSWLWYGKHLAAPRSFDLFSGGRIIVREITGNYPSSIISTYTEETYLYNRSNIAIIKRNGFEHISLKYIVATLNSRLLAFYFIKNTAKAERKLFPKIILNDLRLFPIKNIAIEEQQPFIEIVDKILAAKHLDPTADTTALEKEIDQMVYALYNLTPDEIAIIEK